MKQIRRIWGCVAGVLLAETFTGFGEYRFDVWTAESGLPQNTIRAIVQSREGYLWIGTFDGLARFDGVRFTVFNKANSPDLPGNRVTALYEDREGALWIGLDDGGVARYHQGRFTAFGAQHGLTSTPIHTISGDQHGNLWLASGEGPRQWRDGRFRPCLPESATDFFKREPVRGNRTGVSWARNEEILQVFSRGKLTTLSSSNGLPSLRITHVDEDQYGNWWLATDAGLVQVRDGKVVRTYTQQDGLPRNVVTPGSGAMAPPSRARIVKAMSG